MRVRIDLPELRAEQDAHDTQRGGHPEWKMLPECRPSQVSPRPEWHGREAEMIGPGVVLFDGEKLDQYKIIHPRHLVVL